MDKKLNIIDIWLGCYHLFRDKEDSINDTKKTGEKDSKTLIKKNTRREDVEIWRKRSQREPLLS